MAAVAKRIQLHIILNEREPGVLGMVAHESRLIRRAGMNGQTLQQLGTKGSRQTIRGRAYFSSLDNARNYIKSLPIHKSGESRITTVLGLAVSIQGLIHDIQCSVPYAIQATITITKSKNYTHAVDVDIDFTKT